MSLSLPTFAKNFFSIRFVLFLHFAIKSMKRNASQHKYSFIQASIGASIDTNIPSTRENAFKFTLNFKRTLLFSRLTRKRVFGAVHPTKINTSNSANFVWMQHSVINYISNEVENNCSGRFKCVDTLSALERIVISKIDRKRKAKKKERISNSSTFEANRWFSLHLTVRSNERESNFLANENERDRIDASSALHIFDIFTNKWTVNWKMEKGMNTRIVNIWNVRGAQLSWAMPVCSVYVVLRERQKSLLTQRNKCTNVSARAARVYSIKRMIL